MEWATSLIGIVTSGLGKIGHVLPDHWVKPLLARANDFNPLYVIKANHDLVRAVRLAWIDAALRIFDEADSRAKPGYPEAEQIAKFLTEARPILRGIRTDAYNRLTIPEPSPIDAHLKTVIEGVPESMSRDMAQPLVGELTGSFVSTLAQLTGWRANTIPAVFGNLAAAGLPVMGGPRDRRFGELVLAAFVELLKVPKTYPEAREAFHIDFDNGTRHLVQAVFDLVKGQDATLDALIASADQRAVFEAGAEQWFATLHRDTQAILGDTGELKASVGTANNKLDLLLQTIQQRPQSHPQATEAEDHAEIQSLIARLDRREFEAVLNASAPRTLDAYRARRIARWSQPCYALDKQFTPLTLMLDRGDDAEGARYEKTEEFKDMRKVLAAVKKQEPVIVVTGAPGSGKTTLLRHLELDLAWDALRSPEAGVPLTILLPLNAFGQRGSTIPDPAAWIARQWEENHKELPKFDELLGRPLLLLLDGLNEMPHADRVDYDNRLAAWKHFLDRCAREHPNVRVVFTCRTLDYNTKLTSHDLPRVPQVQVAPLTPPQVKAFLEKHSPEHGAALWAQLDGTPQLELYSSPMYLHLLIQQSGTDGKIPPGRAALFTGYVRALLKREIDAGNPRFIDNPLFTRRDRDRFGERRTPYDLPARGLLFSALSAFAFNLQRQRGSEDKSPLRVAYGKALDELTGVPEQHREPLLEAARDLQIVEELGEDVQFVHQLLQEYFAARHVAARVQAVPQEISSLVALAKVTWREAELAENQRVARLLQTLPKSDTLPDLPTTGWEETFSLVAAMLPAPDEFLNELAAVNLPLAGRCAAQTDVKLSDGVRADLQQRLVLRSRDPATDLRARIQAGHALGTLGDPRFERRQGPHGAYLPLPVIQIEGGVYTIGSDERLYSVEAPAHEVLLETFWLGQFAVTNAEYRCFIDAGGYEEKGDCWWESAWAKRWREGEGTSEEGRKIWYSIRDRYKEDKVLVEDAETYGWPKQTVEQYRNICAMSEDDFAAWVKKHFRDGPLRQPASWNIPALNGASQPVVGICWHEARAYCAWLSAQTGQRYGLPSEAQWEAAARGSLGCAGRRYAWDGEWDAARCNALETKLRRTTPVGVFPAGDTPPARQGVLCDLTGNVWEWTSSLYRRYEYRAGDVRKDTRNTMDARVLRGGSWIYSRDGCRCAYRVRYGPGSRFNFIGFRVCVSSPIS